MKVFVYADEAGTLIACDAQQIEKYLKMKNTRTTRQSIQRIHFNILFYQYQFIDIRPDAHNWHCLFHSLYFYTHKKEDDLECNGWNLFFRLMVDTKPKLAATDQSFVDALKFFQWMNVKYATENELGWTELTQRRVQNRAAILSIM